jgi:undecaprenyl diphosphate synthase
MPEAADAVPRHIAIIMDGNGRWAKQRGLPRIEGHRRGVEVVRSVLEASRDLGVQALTLYAFSVENWKRPEEEVGALMGLLDHFLQREKASLIRNRIRLKTIGQTEALPEVVRRTLAETIAATAEFDAHTLVLALNYGSRTEVVEAARRYARALAEGKVAANDRSWASFSRFLDTGGLPDPDLVIRTSGETRLSNFLLLQSAYAEFVFSPVLWPDFSRADLESAVAEFARRERRFGRTSEQVAALS